MAGSELMRRLARATGHQGRAAQHLALEILRRRGFLAIRSAEPDTLVHLIAWKDRDRPMFVRVKKIRQPVLSAREIVHRWPYEIGQLRKMLILGSVQLWAFSGSWQFYEVLNGGITEVNE